MLINTWPATKRAYILLYLICNVSYSLVTPSPFYAQDTRPTDDIITQVTTYIKHVEPLENFGDKIRKVQIQKILVIDIGDDKVSEVVVWIKPYYHQTPPIFIYQVPDENTVYRLREALAPGPLQDFDRTYLDVHKTGKAADSRIPTTLPMERVLLVANYLRMKSHVVEYQSFSHIEQGTDSGYYVDLRDQQVFNEQDRNSCFDFQFANIEDMVYGRLDPNGPEVFIVKIGPSFYIYHLTGFNQMGLLKKKTMRASVPEDYISFVMRKDRLIGYRSRENKWASFRINLNLLY